MKPKQLANVLIRVLGVSLIARGIPGLINSLINWLQFTTDNHLPLFNDTGRNFHYWVVTLYELVPIVIGFALIAGSRCLVEKLFKDEAE